MCPEYWEACVWKSIEIIFPPKDGSCMWVRMSKNGPIYLLHIVFAPFNSVFIAKLIIFCY